MSVLERQSRFIIKVVVFTMFSYLVVGGCTHFHPATLGILSFNGLLGLTPLIGRRERLEGKVVYDERDLTIGRRATVIGYSVFWVAFVLASMLPFLCYGPDGQITLPAMYSVLILNIALAIVSLARSFAVLALYRWGSGDNV